MTDPTPVDPVQKPSPAPGKGEATRRRVLGGIAGGVALWATDAVITRDPWAPKHQFNGLFGSDSVPVVRMDAKTRIANGDWSGVIATMAKDDFGAPVVLMLARNLPDAARAMAIVATKQDDNGQIAENQKIVNPRTRAELSDKEIAGEPFVDGTVFGSYIPLLMVNGASRGEANWLEAITSDQQVPLSELKNVPIETGYWGYLEIANELQDNGERREGVGFDGKTVHMRWNRGGTHEKWRTFKMDDLPSLSQVVDRLNLSASATRASAMDTLPF